MIYNKFVRYLYFPFTEFIKGENVKKYKKILDKSQYWPYSELKKYQWLRLKNILHHSYEKIPYYRDLFNKNKIYPNDIKTETDFAKIPILTKKDIQNNLLQLTDNEYSGKVFTSKTSGSTGIPLKFYSTPEYSSWDWASRWRGRNLFNVDLGDKEVAVWGRPLYSKKQQIKNYIKGRIRNTLLIPGLLLSEENIKKYSFKIINFNPQYIYGYSLNIFQLALYLKNNFTSLKFNRLKAIFVTAETLFPYQKKIIEETFNVPVSNEYGCSELGGFSYECPYGNWHISIENVLIEFLPSSTGKKEIVGTSLTNYYMPFIRYKIGDLGSYIEKKCSCGCNLPIIHIESAKIADIVLLKNGDSFSSAIFDYIYIALLEKNIQGFSHFQIIQKTIDSFKINYVKNNHFSENSISNFIDLFYTTINDKSIILKFKEVQFINKDKTGKIRYFISEISK